MSEVHVVPVRNQVLCELEQGQAPSHTLTVIQGERAICRFRVLSCGPEVRDVVEGQTVLANRLAAVGIGGQFLLPETAILATV